MQLDVCQGQLNDELIRGKSNLKLSPEDSLCKLGIQIEIRQEILTLIYFS